MTTIEASEHRAAAAESAVIDRASRRLWALPGTALGVNGWPPTLGQRLFLRWNYWWQAHLLDCLVDAQIRDPRPDRSRRIRALVRSIRLRNITGWTNQYYDDMAWLALALQRADRAAGVGRGDVVELLVGQLHDAWSDAEGGGIPWRRGDEFKNTPANGPAAIVLARTGRLDRAMATIDWIDTHLRDRHTGLIWDGLRPGLVEKEVYTYCQGVVLGAELEVTDRTGRTNERIVRLLSAVETHLAPNGVLIGYTGGDSGLFSGILARYLALVATELPDINADARAVAGRLITASADAAWTNAASVDGQPLFGPSWSRAAHRPINRRDHAPERDLSVQLSGWMLMEAAYCVATANAHKSAAN
jgi:predicted alpha-1,6-mannanase (GH76 family)